MSKYFYTTAIILYLVLNSYHMVAQCNRTESTKIYLKQNWLLQQSTKINQTPAQLSQQSVNSSQWIRANVPTTVMGALTKSGEYADLFTSDNYKFADKKRFDDSWLYYTSFDILPLLKENNVTLNFDGINYYANIWLNGKCIASRDTLFGTFRRFVIDITGMVKAKDNRLVVEVFRARPGDFNLGFVDWNPRPLDENMGIWRDVYLKITRSVSMRDTYVRSSIDFEHNTADLTVTTTLTNHSSQSLNGTLTGYFENANFAFDYSLKGFETKEIKIDPTLVPQLRIVNPRLWWCNNLGAAEMYHLKLTLKDNKSEKISDIEHINFGIRKIECYTTSEGYKGYKLNGKPLLIKGAGWTDDIFLRDSLKSIETQVQYAKHMNLNTIRFESIWGTSQDVYDMCDKYGLLAMVGWSCQWEWDEYLGKACGEYGGITSQADMDLIANSFRDQVLWLRNHPSIFVWLVGSDKVPEPALEKRYADLLGKIDDRPYQVSAGTRVSTVSGPSGVKMNGPYEYVSPNYWYLDSINGGAFGFNTETGPGPQVPVKASIENMLPASQLWPPDGKWNYHCTHSTQAFNTMEVFNTALDARYGTSAGLDDYLMKSGAQQYEAMRPMFEAFRSRIPHTTGIIQWMLNSAWPSFYWQLYDYFLVPVPTYYAVRKANQPVQLIFDYGKQTITAVNESGADIRNYQARIRTFDLNSEPVSDNQQMVNLQAGSAVELFKPAQVSQVSFLDLELINDENISLGHNFYWLSPVADLPDWQKTTWAYTPMKSYADFTFLQKRKPVSIHPEYTITKTKDGMLVEVWLKNLDNEIAFMNVLTLADEKGDIIRPVFWDDNYLSLLPGETRRVSCKMDKPDQSKKQIQLWLSSWNTPPKSISIPLPQ